jgi:ribonuclease P protein component
MFRRLTFSRRQRLHLQRDFARVSARRCSVSDGLLVVYVDANGLDWSRLGVKVGKRLGSAVVRSRVKRRVREAFRLGQEKLPSGLDIVCIARPGPAAQAGTEDFARSLERLITQARRKLVQSTSGGNAG